VHAAVILTHLHNGSYIDDSINQVTAFVRLELSALIAWMVAVGVQVSMSAFLSTRVFLSTERLAVTEVDARLSASCEDTSFVLRAAALSIFVGLAIRDIGETYNVHVWLTQFHAVRQWEPLSLQRLRDAHAQPARVLLQPTSGITIQARIYFYICGVVVKLGVAILVVLSGSGVLLHSTSNFNLILNSAAAAFLLELDDVAYQLLVSSGLNTQPSRLDPLGVPAKRLAHRPRSLQMSCHLFRRRSRGAPHSERCLVLTHACYVTVLTVAADIILFMLYC